LSTLGDEDIQFGAVWFGASCVNFKQPCTFKHRILGKSLVLHLFKCCGWSNLQVFCNSVVPVVSHSCKAAEVLHMFIKNGINVEQ
jgi:hypothetical protein